MEPCEKEPRVYILGLSGTAPDNAISLPLRRLKVTLALLNPGQMYVCNILMLLNLGQMYVCTDAVESRSDVRLY